MEKDLVVSEYNIGQAITLPEPMATNTLAFEDLLENLGSEEVGTRRHAANNIKRLTDSGKDLQITDSLVRALDDIDSIVRKTILSCMEDLAEKSSSLPLEAIVSRLDDEDRYVRKHAAWTLAACSKNGIDVISPMLQNLVGSESEACIRDIIYDIISNLVLNSDSVAVAPLVAGLDNPCEEFRVHISDILEKLAKKGYEVPFASIVDRLLDDNREVRDNLAATLLELVDRGASVSITFLLSRLDDENPKVRISIANIIGLHIVRGERVPFDMLISKINDTNSKVRINLSNCVKELAVRGEGLPIKPIIDILADDSVEARRNISKTLSLLTSVGEFIPLELLMEKLLDLDCIVRENIISSIENIAKNETYRISLDPVLNRFGDSRYKREELSSILSNTAEPSIINKLVLWLEDDNTSVRENISLALYNIAIKSGIVVETLSEKINTSYEGLQKGIAFALGFLANKDIDVPISLLVNWIYDEDLDLRLVISRSIAKLAGKDKNIDSQLLLLMLEDPDHNVRRNAVAALAILAGREIAMPIGTIVKKMKDQDNVVRQHISKILSIFSEKDDIPVDIKWLEDDSWDVMFNTTTMLYNSAVRGKEVVKPLLERLDGERLEKGVAFTLSNLSIRGIYVPVNVLIALLSSRDVYTKRNASQAIYFLAKSGVKIPIEHIEDKLLDRDAGVRKNILDAIGTIQLKAEELSTRPVARILKNTSKLNTKKKAASIVENMIEQGGNISSRSLIECLIKGASVNKMQRLLSRIAKKDYSEVVTQIVAKISDHDLTVREGAAKALKLLVQKGASMSVENLVGRLVEPKQDILTDIVIALGELVEQGQSVLIGTVLIDRLVSEASTELRNVISWSLSHLIEKGVDVPVMSLIQHIQSEDPDVRIGIAKAINAISERDPDVPVESLVDQLRDPEYLVRLYLANALLRLVEKGSDLELEPLISLLEDDTRISVIAAKAIRCLVERGAELPESLLRSNMENEFLHDIMNDIIKIIDTRKNEKTPVIFWNCDGTINFCG